MTSTATSSTPAANPFQPACTATSVPPAPHSTTGAQSPAQIASWVSAADVTITSACGRSAGASGHSGSIQVGIEHLHAVLLVDHRPGRAREPALVLDL